MMGAGVLFLFVIIFGGWLVSRMQSRLFQVLGVIALIGFAFVLYFISTSNASSAFDRPIERGMYFK